MAGDVQVKLEIPGSCCALWKNKYSKLEEKRNALRQAVKLLEQQIDKIQAANKKECEEERARVGFEKENKERESSARVALEKEVAELKAEILSLKEKRGSGNIDVNGEVKILQGRIAEGEREIKRLKEAVLSERKRAEAERKIAEVEKRKAAEGLNVVEAVKSEKEIAERYRLQMDVLKKEADEVRSKLAAEIGKLNDANKKLEAEKKRLAKETKRADLEQSKAEQHRKLAESFRQRALEEKNHAETLSRQLVESKSRSDEVRDSKSVLELSLKLEEANKKLQLERYKASREKERVDGESAKVESHKKIAEGNLKKAMEEKSRADDLRRQLEEGKKKISEFEKQSKKLLPFKAASEEVKFLKKQLKFEKAKRKHSKQVVQLERSRNSLLQQEVARLKLEFDQFSCRLDLINKSFSPSGVRDGSQKNGNVIDTPRSALNHSLRDMDTSGTFRQTVQIKRSSPVPGGTCVEPITGTNSKLESLLGGSTRKSPAINSSTTSFSNGQLVGSQDKGAFSVTTSEKLVEEHAHPSGSEMSDEVTAMRSGENLAVVAENSVRGSVSSAEAGKINMNSKKRKRILDTVETIENLYTKDKKLHLQIEEKLSLLHCFVDKDLDKGVKEGKFLPPTFLGSSGAKPDKSTKKRKTLFQQRVVSQHARHGSEQKKTDEVEIQVHRQASPTAVELISRESKGKGTQGLNSINDFEKQAGGDYMNLLNLDDAAFEECYRVAMEIPLSPTLPEIEIPLADTCHMDIALPLEAFRGNLSNKEGVVLASHGFDISSDMSNSCDIASATSSLIHKEQTPVNTLGAKVENWHTSHVENALVCLSHSDAGFQNSGVTITGGEKSRFTPKRQLELSDKILQNAVIFSNLTDRSSISRIYYTIRACMVQFSLATQTRWMVREILLAIKMEEKLAAKEKVCAIFSLLMINFSVVALGNFGDYLNWASRPCLDSFASHVHSVMSDVEIANVLTEVGGLVELLSLIESFLVDERFKVVRSVPFGSSVDCDSGDNIQIDGSNAALSFIPASVEQLVAGSIVLASISAALDHIGFMCETSYNVLRSHRLENSMILSVLHIFAYLGGDKFFSARDHNLLVTVLRPIVRSIEGLSPTAGPFCCTSLVRGDQTVHCERMKCPFWDDNGDAISVDTVTSLLLEKIEADDKLEQLHKHDTKQVYFVTSSNLTDLLALLELVACHMGWDWTSDKIVPKLSNILESSVFNNSSSGIAILIGQVGRLGIQAFGYEDKKVEQIRSDLSAFLQRAITAEASLPFQLATVAALVGLFSVDFATILQANGNSNSGAADVIRKWFSSLNKKHQDLSLKVLQSVN